MKKQIATVLLAILAPLFPSALAVDEVAEKAAADTVVFKSKIVPNKRYVVLQEVFSEMPMPLGGAGNAKTTMSFKTNMVVREMEGSKNRLISVDMGEVKMLIDAAGQKMEYDSSDEAKQNPMLKAMIGGALEAKFDAEVDPSGEVVKVTSKGKKAGGLMGGGFGEEELKQLVASMFDHGFPEKPVKKGESWQHKMETTSAQTGTLAMQMKYTYEGSGDIGGKTYPRLAVKGSKDPNNVPEEGAKKGLVDISKSDSVGHILFDNELGVARESELDMDMTMSVGGNEMSTKSKMYSKLIKVEDLD